MYLHVIFCLLVNSIYTRHFDSRPKDVERRILLETYCQSPPKVPHGSYVCSRPLVRGSLCTLFCDPGYTSPSNTVKCHRNSQWSPALSCTVKHCRQPQPVTGGHYICENAGTLFNGKTFYPIRDVCRLRCERGFSLTSSSANITCGDDGKWSQPPRCIEIKCPNPPVISNGSYKCSTASFLLHTECLLHCNRRYKAHPHISKIHCLPSASWSVGGQCIHRQCPSPPLLKHGFYHCTSNFVGGVCDLHCDTGYKPEASHKIHCHETEQWSTQGRCIAVTTTEYPTTAASSELTSQESTTLLKTVAVAAAKPTSTVNSRPTSTNTTSFQTTTSSTTQAPSISCEVCSGQLCGVVAGNIVTCPHGKSYCLNNFEKEVDGSTTIVKRCATKDECNKRWWLETSDKNSCVKVNPATIFGVRLACTYCCTKSGCNKNTVPDRQTLFVGH